MDEEDDFDLKDVAGVNVPEKDVRWWSKYARRMRFKTEAEAREWVFHKLEHWDTENWSDLFGKNGPDKNHSIADAMPCFQDRHGKWHVGRLLGYYRSLELPGDAEERERAKQVQAILQQYHGGQVQERFDSGTTGDFPDGTSGEPAAPAPYAGDALTNVGLPDYKYIDRLKAKHDKLRKLLQRPDPNGRSRVAWDRRAQAGIRESDEDDFDMKDLDYGPVVTPHPSVPDHYFVQTKDGQHIGGVYKEVLGDKPSVPSLRQLYTEFPWIAQAMHVMGSATRHPSLESAVNRLWATHAGSVGKEDMMEPPEYRARANQLLYPTRQREEEA